MVKHIMENKKKTSLPEKIFRSGVVSWIIVFGVWSLAAFNYDEIFLPSPLETWDALIKIIKDGTLGADILASLSRIGRGWGLAIITAVPIGLLVGHFKHIRWLVEPILSLFRFVPAIALTSLFLMWFGVDDKSRVITGISQENLDNVETWLRTICNDQIDPPLNCVIRNIIFFT